MGFFSNLFDSVKRKQEELKERKEFLNMVEDKAKPIRRMAYMKQMLKEVVNEGVEKAKLDAQKRIPVKKKTPEDFGMKQEKKDPWEYLNNLGMGKDNKTSNKFYGGNKNVK